MIPYLRRQKILTELQTKNIVSLEDLYLVCPDVSLTTIRRDLHHLQKEGMVELLHGGAARLKYKKSSYDEPFENKKLINTKEKEKIAKFAASLVNEGETIYIDSGTTTGFLVDYLFNKEVIVVTSNTKIIEKLEKSNLSCILLGGEYIKELASVSGGITNTIISNLYFDKAFIGASGYSMENGFNTPDYKERDKKQLVFKNSKESFLLVDHSKAQINTTYKVFELQECTVITDRFHDLLEKVKKYFIAT